MKAKSDRGDDDKRDRGDDDKECSWFVYGALSRLLALFISMHMLQLLLQFGNLPVIDRTSIAYDNFVDRVRDAPLFACHLVYSLTLLSPCPNDSCVSK